MQKLWGYLSSITKFDRSVRLNIFAYASIGFVVMGTQGVLSNLYLVALGLDLAFMVRSPPPGCWSGRYFRCPPP